MAIHAKVHETVFLNILLGGVAAAAGSVFRRVYAAEREPFIQRMIQIDTHSNESCAADARCVLTTTSQDMEALIANAQSYGPHAVAIVDQIADMLRPGDILNGARTTRCLTQLMFLFCQRDLYMALRECITELRRQTRLTSIRPVLISSSGGGTGSALQVLLLQALHSPYFRRRMLLGEDDHLLLPPVSFVVEPIYYARHVGDIQAHRILANAAAFRVETESLLQRGQGPDYVFHLGYSNDEGAVVSSSDDMGRTLGECVYQIERCWPEFKNHWVDNVDSNSAFLRYRGVDTVQRLWPDRFVSDNF